MLGKPRETPCFIEISAPEGKGCFVMGSLAGNVPRSCSGSKEAAKKQQRGSKAGDGIQVRATPSKVHFRQFAVPPYGRNSNIIRNLGIPNNAFGWFFGGRTAAADVVIIFTLGSVITVIGIYTLVVIVYVRRGERRREEEKKNTKKDR
ncbi:hypothetical protein B0T20DRAFT_392995 [Sordaria brevicollis]|uniref:Uncharacterized protein n=1 Tax=Sordaria brevicollis TaxID=83679 RepID=A0AAE0PER7_SORBR|nr:hypothetical protein B0T20DRAFT_392995 [Sordaria brevicollis]